MYPIVNDPVPVTSAKTVVWNLIPLPGIKTSNPSLPNVESNSNFPATALVASQSFTLVNPDACMYVTLQGPMLTEPPDLVFKRPSAVQL